MRSGVIPCRNTLKNLLYILTEKFKKSFVGCSDRNQLLPQLQNMWNVLHVGFEIMCTALFPPVLFKQNFYYFLLYFLHERQSKQTKLFAPSRHAVWLHFCPNSLFLLFISFYAFMTRRNAKQELSKDCRFTIGKIYDIRKRLRASSIVYYKYNVNIVL